MLFRSIRAALEYVEIPVTYTRQDLSLPIGRVREIFQFFATLEPLRNDLKRASELEALLVDAAGVQSVSRNPWWNLLSICLQAWHEETGNSELPVKQAIDYLWEALAEQKRDRHMGRGVFLSSVHYAKGTEFDHVFVADGGWNEKKGEEEEERRVYYVAMTRAKQTLTLFQREDERNPYCDILKRKVSGEQLVTFVPGEKNIPDAVLQRRYDIIGLKDVFLDYAGRMTASYPVHQLLEQTMVGDLVQFKNAGERLEVCTPAGQPIAVLSKTAKEKWTDAQGQIESIKVLAIVERRTDDSKNPDYKNLLQVESWEVPVLEVVWSVPSQ